MVRYISTGLVLLHLAVPVWACGNASTPVAESSLPLVEASSTSTPSITFVERTLNRPTFVILESREDGALSIWSRREQTGESF
ncbi:MAG: hypothetical protein AB8G16_06060 [Gammaproteobacteria bacterium]